MKKATRIPEGKKKKKPIPTRLDEYEESLLKELKKRTGLSVSELIRRAVRMVGREVKSRNSVDFLLTLTTPDGE